jgi:hypothetical protein
VPERAIHLKIGGLSLRILDAYNLHREVIQAFLSSVNFANR